ncbi:MAG: hypothetical protein RLZ21_543, partial [Pseudomonadota bacterium]
AQTVLYVFSAEFAQALVGKKIGVQN